MFQSIISIVLVASAALIQITNYFSVGNIKPDLSLVFILAIALKRKEWIIRLILVLIAALILKFSVSLDAQLILFIMSAVLGMIILDYLPGTQAINFVFAIAAATIFTNISTNFNFNAIFTEMIYNVILSWPALGIVCLSYGKKNK